jgi:hypothetical protein
MLTDGLTGINVIGTITTDRTTVISVIGITTDRMVDIRTGTDRAETRHRLEIISN